ncbi:MAG: MCP1 family protein [Arthrobacter sp.]
MLPHPARPAEAAEDTPEAGSQRDDERGDGGGPGKRERDSKRAPSSYTRDDADYDADEHGKIQHGNPNGKSGKRPRVKGGRGRGKRGTPGTVAPVFVPPLAPSPPPGTPPTVHTRPASNELKLSSGMSSAATEQQTAESQSGSFSSILSGETFTDPYGGSAGDSSGDSAKDSSGRAYHLRTPFNPVRLAQWFVFNRAVQDAESREEEHPNTGPITDAETESDGQETTAHDKLRRADQHDDQPDGHRWDELWEEQDNQIDPQNYPLAEHQAELPLIEHQDVHAFEQSASATNTIRRTAVTICTTSALAAAYVLTRTASGWPQIDHSPGSVLDPSASLLAAYPWIWLAWLPVLVGAAVYAGWQWLPTQRTNPRQTWTGPVSAGSATVAALWLWAVHSGNPAAATGAAALGIGIGLAGIHLSNTRTSGSRAETAAADVSAAIALGASTLALLSGLGSWLTASDADAAGWGGDAWSLIALVATVVGITTVSMTDRGHLAAALTVVAGLTCIGFARILTGEASGPVAAGAFIGGFLILVSAGSRRHQVDHAQRRRVREWLRAEASAPAAGEALEAVRI